MPFFFRTDGRDGLGARFAEHDATIPYWQSNTLLTRDGDFLRYSFRAPVEQLAPIFESLEDHLARLSAGQFAQADFADAIADERQFQVRQSQAGRSLKDALCRAATHDRQANEALDIASQLDRLSPRALSDLAKTLTFEKATIGIRGPVGPVTESLKKLGLKPTTVTPPDPPAANTGASAP
jgi:predicted Zn-dependent peptidase